MQKLLCLLFLIVLFSAAKGQPNLAVVDSVKKEITAAKTVHEKFELTNSLARMMMNVNPVEAERLGQQLLEMAEVSRDKRLLVRAYLANGERASFVAGRKDNIDKAIYNYNKALEVAKKHNIQDLIVGAYIKLSEIHRMAMDTDKAFVYSNQALSYADLQDSDSLRAQVKQELGTVYLAKSEKLTALQTYLQGLQLSEKLKNPHLLRASYSRLSMFYSSIKDYDTAIGYLKRSMEQLEQFKSGSTPYNKIQDYNRIGDLYTADKNYHMSMYYYEKALQLADSIKYAPIKVMSHRSIINNYLEAGQPDKALRYYEDHPQLKEFLERLNFGYFTKQSYGYIYMQMGKYDSAKMFYNQAAPFFENDVNSGNQFSYYYQLGLLHSRTGEYDKSIGYFQKANEIAVRTSNLELMHETTRMLDSVSQRKGDYKQAISYSNLHHQYKDSLDNLEKEGDIIKAQVDDERLRRERIQNEQEEAKRRKNNIQYIGIIFGIVVLFLALAVLGMFKVSAGLIKGIGFFVFLMLFEFIFLVFKKNIYSVTKGEPLMDLLFMIGLAALLVPLHHWLEHRVLHYLTSHNRLTSAGHHIKRKLFRRTEGGEQ